MQLVHVDKNSIRAPPPDIGPAVAPPTPKGGALAYQNSSPKTLLATYIP